MAAPCSIEQYLQTYGNVTGNRVLAQFPPLHSPTDPVWPELLRLKRRPFPAQTLAGSSVYRGRRGVLEQERH